VFLMHDYLCSVSLGLLSCHKGSDAPSVTSPVVDEERMRPGHWLWSLLCFHQCFHTVGKLSGRASSP